MKRGAFAIAILLAALALPAWPGDWPSFHGTRAEGVGDGPLASTWDATQMQNIAWKTPIPGLAHSSPITWGDRVFLTTAVAAGEPTFRSGLYGDVDPVENEPPQRYLVMALDLKTGKVLWERTAAEGPVKIKRHLKASHASSTPATDGKHLVAIFGPEGLFCYDLDGKLLWRKDLGTLDAGWFFNPAYQWGYASSPILYRDLVIVQADVQQGSFIAAFKLADGTEAWRTSRDEIPSWGTPTIVEAPSGPELVTNGSRFLRGYDPLTGKELWRMQNRSEITVATPVATQGLVLFTNGYRPVPSVVAVRAGARGDVSLKEGETANAGVAWYKDKGGTYMPTPVVVGDHFYTLANQGVLTCYDARSGEKVYQERVGGTGGAFTASIVAGDGRLYLASEDGDVWVIKAGAKYEQIAKNPMGEVMMATPAIAGGRILIRTRGNLVAISPPAAPAAAPAAR